MTRFVRSRQDADLATRLVDLLQDARVTPGAQGIAYSCLLDVLTAAGANGEALRRLGAAIDAGVRLEDLNRTALVRLKQGAEAQGLAFPFDIPKKNAAKNLKKALKSDEEATGEEDPSQSRCLSPLMD